MAVNFWSVTYFGVFNFGTSYLGAKIKPGPKFPDLQYIIIPERIFMKSVSLKWVLFIFFRKKFGIIVFIEFSKFSSFKHITETLIWQL